MLRWRIRSDRSRSSAAVWPMPAARHERSRSRKTRAPPCGGPLFGGPPP
jgi:hypothetical protein